PFKLLTQATEAQITGSPWNACAKARLHRPACATESSPQRLEVGRELCWNVARRLGGMRHPWDGTAAKGHPTAALPGACKAQASWAKHTHWRYHARGAPPS